MSADSLNNNISVQLENWFEKHSHSHPRRWLKRYFRFDGEHLSYSKNDSSSGKFIVNISDILDVKMKSDTDGKDILEVTMKSFNVESSNENEIEISMPNPQILKTWYNAIKECIDNKIMLQNRISTYSSNKSASSIYSNDDMIRNAEILHINKPLTQPNLFNKGTNVIISSPTNSLSRPSKNNRSVENVNKKRNSEKSSALSKLDALLGDLQNTMSLNEVERKSIVVINNFERLGLSPTPNESGSTASNKNYGAEKNNTSPDNHNKMLSSESIIADERRIKMNSMPPNRKNPNIKSKMISMYNVSEHSLHNSEDEHNYKNSFFPSPVIKNKNGNEETNETKDELNSDANKKISSYIESEKDRPKSENNSSVINNKDNSETENSNINLYEKKNSQNIEKQKELEVYTQFKNSLNTSLDLVNILIQIFDISSDSIDNFYTEYKEVILVKSSDLINESSNLFKQISDETQDTNESKSETAIVTKNPKMIELGNELASIIRKVVSSLKMYLSVVKKDQLIKENESTLESSIISENEENKKIAIFELKQYMDELKNNLLIFEQEIKKIDI